LLSNSWFRINNLVRYVSKLCLFHMLSFTLPDCIPLVQSDLEIQSVIVESYSVVECAQCCLWFYELPSPTSVQRKFKTKYHKNITPKNYYFSVVKSVCWNWLCINRTLVAWIGRGGTIAWPPRSPDLTPLNFLCGDTLRIKLLFQLFLQIWKICGHR
jgi:hypothetical protein